MASLDLLERLNYARFVLLDRERNRVICFFREVDTDSSIHLFDLAGNKLFEITIGESEEVISQETMEAVAQEIVEKGWFGERPQIPSVK